MGNFFYLKKIRYKCKYVLAGFMATAFCLFMLLYPNMSLVSAQKGIVIWVNNILPTMFPFFICANFMNNIGITSYLKPGSFAFSMSILSGYPMGAKILGDMCRNDVIGREDCRRLVGYCSTSGPAFILGTIGTSMLGNHIYGLVILAAHYLGAILNGTLFSYLFKYDRKNKNGKSRGKGGLIYRKNNYDNLLECLTDAIYTSFKSLGIIMAYVIMFI